MQRIKAIPVEQPKQPFWRKKRGLDQLGGAVFHRLGLELQLRDAGYFHFGPQPQQVIRLDGLYTPEIERISDP